MTSFQITELKKFMGRLLGTDCFDSFLLVEATICTAVEYKIDGRIHKDFYDREEQENLPEASYEYARWGSLRQICFALIKGRRTPTYFKFVLHLMPEYVPGVLKGADASLAPEQVKALVLTIKYDNGAAAIITGTAFTSFVMDKTLDMQWDKTMRQFLAKKGIACTET